MAFNGPDLEEGPTIIVVKKGHDNARQIVFNKNVRKPDIRVITIDEAREIYASHPAAKIAKVALVPTLKRMAALYCKS